MSRKLGSGSELGPKRRVLRAIAVGLLVEVSLVGAVGFVAAGEPEPGTPGAMALPRPHVGDRGTYTLTVVRLEGDTPQVVREERPLLDFHWLSDRWLRDARGQVRLVQELDTVTHWEQDGQRHTSISVLGLDPSSGSLVAYRNPVPSDYGADGRSSPSLPSSDTELSEAYVTWLVQPGEQRSAGLCGLRNHLQGRSVDITRPVALYRACSLNNYWVGLDEDCTTPEPVFGCDTFKARGTERLGGRDTVLFSRVVGKAVHLWLTEDLPYPVRIAVEHQRDSGTFDVIRLAAFERGSSPVAPATRFRDDPLPPLEFAPALSWGPDDTGVEHPFPASQAWEVAMGMEDDTTFRDFVERHPGSHLGRGSFKVEVEDDHTRYRWVVTLMDGSEVLTLGIVKEVRPVYAQVLGPNSLPVRPTELDETRYYLDHRWLETTIDNLPAEAVPRELPTVASMLAWWRAYAEGDEGTDVPPGWAFDVFCRRRGDECLTVEMSLRPGISHFGETHGLSRTVAPDTHKWRNTSHLWMDHQGNVRYVMEGTSAYRQRASPFPATSEPAATGPAFTTAFQRVSLWSFPDGYLAAAGLVAALTAVLYWAAPALKSLPFLPSYSRIDRHAVLEHAARARMVERIRQEPGIHFNDLARRMGMGQGQARHHLRKLIDSGLVVERAGPRYTCYFPAGGQDPGAVAGAQVLKAPGARRVFDLIAARPGLSNQEVAAVTGLSPATVNYHVKRLVEAGLVESTRAGRVVRLVARPPEPTGP